MAMVGQFEEDFERAKSQVSFLFPELDLSSLDSLKIAKKASWLMSPDHRIFNLISPFCGRPI